MIIAVIVLGVLVILLVALLFLRRPMAPVDSQSSLMLKQDLTKLSEDITKLKDGLQTQLT